MKCEQIVRLIAHLFFQTKKNKYLNVSMGVFYFYFLGEHIGLSEFGTFSKRNSFSRRSTYAITLKSHNFVCYLFGEMRAEVGEYIDRNENRECV